jgi:hypothetical protein
MGMTTTEAGQGPPATTLTIRQAAFIGVGAIATNPGVPPIWVEQIATRCRSAGVVPHAGPGPAPLRAAARRLGRRVGRGRAAVVERDLVA